MKTSVTQPGFTLVELLCVIAITGILMGIAVPSFSNLIADTKMTSFTNSLVTNLHMARSESIKRNVPVSICSSSDQQTCADSLDWSIGWIIYTDNTGIAGSKDAADQILYTKQQTISNITVTVDGSYVRFMPNGFIN